MKKLYPGIFEAEAERNKRATPNDDEPDFLAGEPNYDKFPGWDPIEILAWLNID
jgi:hypothetical protein